MTGSSTGILLLDADGRRTTLSYVELPAELSKLRGPGGPVVWIHAASTPEVIQALEDMGLDEVAVKSLRDGPERPRVEEFLDHLYMSLFSAGEHILESHQASADSEAAQCDVDECLPPLKELRLFLGDRWVISVGDVARDDYATLAERVNRQVFARDRGPSFIAYHICDWLVESLQPGIEELDERIDQLEDEVVLNSRQDAVRGLFSLKKDIVELRRQVSPVRDVMQRLGSHGVVFIEPEAEVYFRDVHDDVMRVIELLDTYRDILSSALDLHLSSVSNRLNVVMKQLTVVATAFLPLTFLVGLFGTNFTRMPYASWGWFLAMWILMLLSVAGIALYTRKRT